MDYVISTGNHFYPDGVDSMFDFQWTSIFENIYSDPPLNHLEWLVTLGNRDWRKSPTAQIEYQSKSSRWTLPYFRYKKEFLFNSDEKAQFLFISTTPFSDKDRIAYPEVDKYPKKDEISWLRKELEKGEGQFRWRFVIGHHPIYSSGPNGNFGYENMTDIEELFNKHRVDGYFSGHDYILQHLRVNSTEFNHTMNYYISGAAGQSIGSELPRHVFNVFGYGKSEGFITLSLTQNQTNIYFLNNKGSVIYHDQKNK